MRTVVLAGGSGTRLWPASTPATPKQFLNINGDDPLLLQTLKRAAIFCPEEHIYVITRESFGSQVSAILQDFSPLAESNVIFEPSPRNTCAAILLSAKYLESRPGVTLDEVMLVLPSDHLITDHHNTLDECLILGRELARQGHIVVFGIVPDKPETGYGYIKLDRNVASVESTVPQVLEGIPVEAFVEKPAAHLAEEYLKTGQYLWNAGMFAMSLKTLYAELELYFPESKPFLLMSYDELIAHFEEFPNISFDFAVMEKTNKSTVVPMNIQWSDVGSWDSIYEILPKDNEGNGIQGAVKVDNTSNSLLVNKTEQLLLVSGIDNKIVIKTCDGVLIIPRGESQKIGKLTSSFKRDLLVSA